MATKRKKEKNTFRIYAEYLPFRLLYAALQALPLKVGYALSNALFGILFAIDRRHRVRTIQHVMHAGITKDRNEARAFARRSYGEFAKLLVEVVKMDQLYDRSKLSAAGDPASVAAVFPGGGTPGIQVIITSAHYGNWEVAGTAFSDMAGRPMSSFMRPFANPLIGRMILGQREGGVHDLIDKNAGVRPILRAAAAGRNLTMLVDQHASGAEGVECKFFGHPAQIHRTPALLHLKTGIPIQPEITRRKPGANFEFELVLGPLIRYTPTGDKEHDIAAISQEVATAMEQLIMENPVQWLWTPRHWLDINRRQAAKYSQAASQ